MISMRSPPCWGTTMSNEHWVEISFTEVLDIQGGTQPPKKDFVYEPQKGFIQLLQIRDFGSKEHPTFIKDSEKLKKCGKEDILIGRYGASVGKILTGKEGAYNVAIAKVIIPESIEKRYVYSYLNSYLFQQPIKSIERSAQDGFNKEDLQKISFYLPPLKEQKRIVEKLDGILPKVRSSKVRLEKIPILLKRFRQSVLAAACSGRLTEDWREGKPFDITENISVADENPYDLPNNWIWSTLATLSNGFQYGTSSKSDKQGLIPVLRMGNLQDGIIDWSDLKYTNDTSEIEKYKLIKGDVLFNRTNSPDLVGKTSIYQGDRPAIFAGYLIKIKNNKSILKSEYLNICLNADRAREWCKQVKTDGVSQSNINAQVLSTFLIPLPPLEEQQEIVRRVEKLFHLADSLEAKYQKAMARINKLEQAVLAKAFRGELAEAEEGDEPAAELLGRIMAEKEKGGRRDASGTGRRAGWRKKRQPKG